MSPSPQSAERRSNFLPKTSGPLGASTGSSNDASVSQSGVSLPQREVPPRNSTVLPSLATLTGEAEGARDQGGSGSPNPWRTFGVHNILNPASESQPVPPSPQTSIASSQQITQAGPQGSPHIRKRGELHSPALEAPLQHGGRPVRRMLTPRSPALRAASMGSHRSPSMGAGNINRIPLPSGESRAYTVEPGENRDATIPPLPPPPSGARGTLPGMQARDLGPHHANPSNQGSNPTFPASGTPTVQQDNRHESLRPSYANNEVHATNFHQNQPQMSQPQASAESQSQSQGSYMPSGPGPVRSGLPYGQTDLQLTFETQQGSVVVPVSVDYQQASRLADEKRKRNAGASARFRARRKEKEREANQTIAGLQQELQDASDQRDFYMRERDYYRDLLARSVQGPLPARPHSPPSRRVHAIGSSASDTTSNADYGRPDMDVPGAQRRRTGDYQPSMPSQSPGTPYHTPYSQGPSLPLPTPQQPSNFPDPRPGPPGPPSQVGGRPPPYDPLRRGMLDREWNTGR